MNNTSDPNMPDPAAKTEFDQEPDTVTEDDLKHLAAAQHVAKTATADVGLPLPMPKMGTTQLNNLFGLNLTAPPPDRPAVAQAAAASDAVVAPPTAAPAPYGTMQAMQTLGTGSFTAGFGAMPTMPPSQQTSPKPMEKPSGGGWAHKLLGNALGAAGEHLGSFRLGTHGPSAGAVMSMIGMRGPGEIAKDLPGFLGLGGESKGKGGLSGLLFGGGKEGGGQGSAEGGNDDLLAAIRKLTDSVDKLVAVMGGSGPGSRQMPGSTAPTGPGADVLSMAMKAAMDGLKQQGAADGGILSAIARSLPTIATAAAAVI